MICKPDRWLAAVLLLLLSTGCTSGDQPAANDWRAHLAAHEPAAARSALVQELGRGAPRNELAPWFGEAALQEGNLAEARTWLEGKHFAPQVAVHGFRMLARLHLREGDLPAAGRALDKALSHGGSRDGRVWADIARLRWRGGEQRQAIEASGKAFALAPKHPEVVLLRGQIVRDSQGNRAALAVFEEGLAAAPRDVELLAETAATLGELGRAREMLSRVRELAEVAPDDWRVYWLQGVLAARAGDWVLAQVLVQRSRSRHETLAADLMLARIDIASGNYASAAQTLDRLDRAYPDHRDISELFAYALLAGGNFRELAARFGSRDDNPFISGLVGRAHEGLGNRERAAPYLDAAMPRIPSSRMRVLAPSGGTARQGAANAVRAALQRNAPEEAVRITKANLARLPGSFDAIRLAGDAALAAGDARGAAQFYAQASGIRRVGSLARKWAYALQKAGDGRGADAVLRRYAADSPLDRQAGALRDSVS